MIASLALLAMSLSLEVPYKLKVDGIPEPTKKRIQTALDLGCKRIDRYFSKPFPHTFPVIVAAHRTDFDKETATRWKMPPSAKWMVGAGVSDVLILLSPDAWNSEALEHDGSSEVELQQIVAHELAHVYHGQICPKHDFDGMDDMGWFVEGLAAMVSGQLDGPYRYLPARAIEQGKAPSHLADAWSGQFRYGVSASMVRFVETNWGKSAVLKLMNCTTNDDALKVLGMTEDEFLKRWRETVKKTT